ncbi:MAG TPA: HlyD family efflux transporter periplasmic adaptor subunit [Verrucomicrobiae bacterium]|jgi:multidrug resistance efflux pump
MNAPQPIPTPPALRWREFRVRVLPVLLFVVALGGAGYLWQHSLNSPALVGAVEVRSAQVTVPYAGKILQLNVDNFQVVTQGAPLAVLVPSDPRAALAVVQSELDILQAKLDPYLTQQRNETDYERLRMDWLLQRVDLATARVNYELVHSELVRTQELHALKLIPDDLYEVALKTDQALAVEVLERSNLVATAERGIKSLENLGAPQPETSPVQPLLATLKVEEQKLARAAAGTEPVTLVAPMEGAISIVRQAGENLTEGEAALTVTATKPEHIISYLRQPIPFEPRVGMQMEVRTRTYRIQSGVARIENVGSQFEGITNALAILRPGVPVDLGLPIQISLPPGLKMRPGELVDLTLVSEN